MEGAGCTQTDHYYDWIIEMCRLCVCPRDIIENCPDYCSRKSTFTPTPQPTAGATVGESWPLGHGNVLYALSGVAIGILFLILVTIIVVAYKCTKRSSRRDEISASASEKGQLMEQQFLRQNSTSTNTSSSSDVSNDVTCCGYSRDDKKAAYQQNICVNNQINVLGTNKAHPLQGIPEEQRLVADDTGKRFAQQDI